MYAVLPKGAKPSKSVSTDQTRPNLNRAELRQTKDGWEITATDSYQLARVPVEVRGVDDEPALTAGPIPLDALKACEKAGAFRANGTIEPTSEHGLPTGASFTRPTEAELGRFPNVDQLMPQWPEDDTITIGLNPDLLHKLAQSLGSAGARNAPLKLTIHSPHRPMIVEIGEAKGLLMPIRLP